VVRTLLAAARCLGPSEAVGSGARAAPGDGEAPGELPPVAPAAAYPRWWTNGGETQGKTSESGEFSYKNWDFISKMRNYINQNADLTRKHEDLTGRRKW